MIPAESGRPYCRHLADAKTDNIANIIRIDPWYQSWYQGHADAILGAVSNRLFFKLQERFYPQFTVDIIPSPIELHEDKRQPCFSQGSYISLIFSQTNTIAIEPEIFTPHVLGIGNNLRQIIADRGSPPDSCKKSCPGGSRQAISSLILAKGISSPAPPSAKQNYNADCSAGSLHRAHSRYR